MRSRKISNKEWTEIQERAIKIKKMKNEGMPDEDKLQMMRLEAMWLFQLLDTIKIRFEVT